MFQIERRGTFQMQPDGSAARCGEPWTADYGWRVVADVERLTDEGWTVDNHAVPMIVEAVVASRPQSCERFCADVCARMLAAIGAERALRVVAEIEGIPGSWIRAEWQRA